MPLNILMGAEPYGFGPSSKAIAIARIFGRRFEQRVDFVGSGTALAAAQREADLFASVAPTSTFDLDTLVGMVEGRDLVVSVMEPSIALAAAFSRVPCVYVDSLFWMWDWPDDLAEIDGPHEGLIKDLVSSSSPGARRQALEAAGALPMHEAQYVAHRVSTLVCFQRYDEGARAHISAARERCRTLAVGAIIDPASDGESSTSGDVRVMVSVGGLSNELTDSMAAVSWADTIIQLVLEAAQISGVGDGAVRVGGNPIVLGQSIAATSRLVHAWPTHAMFMSDLSACEFFFAPPGITSIAEAWSAKVPFFALPGQHYAHGSILRRLRAGTDEVFPGIDVGSQRQNREISELTSLILQDVAAQFGRGGRLHDLAVETLASHLSLPGVERTDLARLQGGRLSSVFGTDQGASEVAAAALNVAHS
ncbi:hypothetical protein [Promicromonospora kroppenstedtii]|uniref:hypothetical protein n=1 Tax=Promicromonospora kroppenstedtii TaxID=440482 RepID=UPI0004B267AD|nr:hypothetical protein [Promicromonospora kroppenstedtii]